LLQQPGNGNHSKREKAIEIYLTKLLTYKYNIHSLIVNKLYINVHEVNYD